MDIKELYLDLKHYIKVPDRTDFAVFFLVLIISAAASFTYLSAQEEDGENVDLSGEINSTENQKVISFYNESAELMVEQSPKADFYIDLDRDGSADIQLNLDQDGKIRKDSRILDYRSGSYLLKFTYSDDANQTEDHWLRPTEIKLLR
ncbi:MAG: hypothetical protein J07AB43_16760 [Candidatus Nanosalina sp. J07AB43]|nr:MAG: hypothetical protein J07AB43_16760 [Candidatus Nanosalina sp. J07AB43]